VSITRRDVEVAGLGIHVATAGAGPPLLVLHRSTGPMWTPFYDELSRTYELIAPDLPGYGESERPETARSPRDLAILMVRSLDALGHDAVHAVGLGLGGWVLAELATMAPRRLSTMTRSEQRASGPERDSSSTP
jgi:pimeloyl-ACP methyl ester carboxylesterase